MLLESLAQIEKFMVAFYKSSWLYSAKVGKHCTIIFPCLQNHTRAL